MIRNLTVKARIAFAKMNDIAVAKTRPLTDADRARLDDIRDNCQTCGLPFEGRWKLCTDLECRSYEL